MNTEALKRYAEKVQNGEVQRTDPMTPLEKARKFPKSLRLAINAKCYDCTCFQRQEVKKCEMTDCPLWNVRPWQ